MATIKTCAALVKGFGEDKFIPLEARAFELAGGNKPTNKHYIAAAKDMIATREEWIRQIDAALGKEAPAPAAEPEAAKEEAPAEAPEKPARRKKVQPAAPETEAETEAETEVEASGRLSPERWQEIVDAFNEGLREFSMKQMREALMMRRDTLSMEEGYNLDQDSNGRFNEALRKGDFALANSILDEVEAFGNMDRGGDFDFRFRQTDAEPPSKTISRGELEKIVADVEKFIGGKVNVEIVDSITDKVPGEAPGSAAGAIDAKGNKVFLFLDGIPSGEEGLKTVFHEFFHKGLRHLLPEAEYKGLMVKLYNSVPEVTSTADKWLTSPDGKNKLDGLMQNGVKGKALRDEMQSIAAEEALAKMAESTNLRPGTIRRLGNWLADVADRIGMKRLAQMIRRMGMSDLEAFVQDALRAAGRGAPMGKGPVGAPATFAPGTTTFKKWFGDSKVVDKDGKPLVVHHSTYEDFNAFKEGEYLAGMYFSDDAVYSSNWGDRRMDVYLKMERPLDLRRAAMDKALEEAEDAGISSRAIAVMRSGSIVEMLDRDYGGTELQSALVKAGYDGIMYENDTGGGTTYVVFNPTQIKSVFNQGTWDANNPDIRFAPGTTAFNKWFGGSKIVDKDGKPLVMYHGMDREMEGGVFRESRDGTLGKGIYFAYKPHVASNFAMGVRGSFKRQKSGGNVVPVYLKMDMPFDDDFFAGNKDWQQWVASILRGGYPPENNLWPDYSPYRTIGPQYRSVLTALHDKLMAGKATLRDVLFLGDTDSETGWGDKLLKAVREHGAFDGIILKDSPKGFGEVVVFNPTQIKSAFNQGTWDANNPDIRYRTVESAVQTMGDYLKYDGLSKARRGVLSMSFLRDLNDRFKKDIAGVEDFTKATFEMSNSAAEYQEQGVKVFDALNALSQKEKSAVMDLMADATSSEVHVEKDNPWLTDAQRPREKELKQRFTNMNDRQKRAYRIARDTLASNWKKRGELLAAKIDEIYDPLIGAAKAAGDERKVKELERERRAFLVENNKALSSIRGDYFPMMRFGEYAVVRKSKSFEELASEVEDAHKALQALYDKYESRTPAERAEIKKVNKRLAGTGSEFEPEFTPEQAEEIKAARKVYTDLQTKLEKMKASEDDYYMAQFDSLVEANADAARVGGEVLLKRDRSRELSPVARPILERIDESVTTAMRARGNAEALREARQALYQVYLTSLPERSALLRTAKRKYVAGFDRDMERAVISSILTDSFYLSRMEHADKIMSSLNSVWSNAKGVDQQEVARELDRRLLIAMKRTDTPVQDVIAGVTYAWLLGVSPGYLLANMTQPFLVSMPMMWSRHGMKSGAAFGKALADTSRLLTKHAGSILRGELRLDDSGLAADEAKMLQEMLRNRLLSVTLVGDLARTADGKAVSRFASLVSRPAHVVEMANRISTALAAYRLEKAKSGPDKAQDYAAKVLADTHFDYSAENAPYWMSPGALPGNKILFQFKKYQLGMVSLLVKTLAAVAKGDRVSKAEAKRMIYGVLTTHLAVGGALGLPAIGTAMALANAINSAFGDEDEPWDARVALRNYFYDEFGPEVGTALSKGIPTLLGADMSQKVGLADVLNPLPTLREDKQGREFYLELLAAGMGPFFGGIAPRAFDSSRELANGNFLKAAEGMVPKWVSDPIRAGRFAEEGVTTRQGTVALPRDQIGFGDLFYQAIGIPALEITESFEGRAAVERVKRQMNERIGRLKDQWADANKSGDTAAAREIWDEIRTEVNPARRRNGLDPVTLSDLYRFQAQRGKTEDKYRDFGANATPQMSEVARFAR